MNAPDYAERVAGLMFHEGLSREKAARRIAVAACVPLGDVLDALPLAREPEPPAAAPGGILSAEEISAGAAALEHFLTVSRPLGGISSHLAESVGNVRRALLRCPSGARLEALPSDQELATVVYDRHVARSTAGDLRGADDGIRRSLPPAEEPPFDPPFDDPHGRDPVG